MNTIDARVLRDAAVYVDECAQHAEIHTVTLITNGAHGGVDVTIEGTVELPDAEWVCSYEDYKRTYQVGGSNPGSVTVYEYVTFGYATHLVLQGTTDRTICGRPVTFDAVNGDETTSGIAATCLRCKNIVRPSS